MARCSRIGGGFEEEHQEHKGKTQEQHSNGQDPHQVLLKSQAIQEVHQDPRTTKEIKILGSSSKSHGEMGPESMGGSSLRRVLESLRIFSNGGLELQWSVPLSRGFPQGEIHELSSNV